MPLFRPILIDDERHCLGTLSADLARYHPDIELIDQFHSSKESLAWLKRYSADVAFLVR